MQIGHAPLRLASVLALLLVAACDASMPTNQAGIERARAAGAPEAFYAAFPDTLYLAVEAGCNRPGDSFVRASNTEVRCETLLPPEVTGGVIIRYNGTVEDLPKLVTAFIAQSAQQGGWVVTADTYLRVPLREGGIREVRSESEDVDDAIRELLRLSGGSVL